MSNTFHNSGKKKIFECFRYNNIKIRNQTEIIRKKKIEADPFEKSSDFEISNRPIFLFCLLLPVEKRMASEGNVFVALENGK